ncbi:hypothetical protein ACWEQ2_02775 [Streptomyces sp. NPDC004096]|uniref:hypothetical protein n=1 Tax=unclassified Streptomyces TaxID=2593676 RepID=UPI0033BC634D
MVALFLFFILVAIALGLVGALMQGLFYLLIIGAVIFVADFVLMGANWRRAHRHIIR